MEKTIKALYVNVEHLTLDQIKDSRLLTINGNDYTKRLEGETDYLLTHLNVATVEFTDDLDSDNNLAIYRKLLNCDMIDCVSVRIGDNPKYFDVICDDESRLVGKRQPSLLMTDGRAYTMGNILIVNATDNGEWESLTDDEIQSIKKNMGIIHEVDCTAICNVQYEDASEITSIFGDNIAII